MISDDEVMILWKSGNKPTAGLRPALIEYPGAPEPAEYFAIRLYRNIFDSMSPLEQRQSIGWVQDKLEFMSQFVPISLEMWRSEGSKN